MAMKIQKGIVKYKDRNDIVCNYGINDANVQYYFMDNGDYKTSNGSYIASTALVEAIDPMVKASHVGLVGQDGNEIIPFENKSIKPIDTYTLIVEGATPTTQSVIDAVNLRNDPLSATKLVSTPATIKAKISEKIGGEGRYLFNDQFSEATICDVNGNNLVNGEKYSFISTANNQLYMSKNTADSDIAVCALMSPAVQSNDSNVIDVGSVQVDQQVVENALTDQENTVPTENAMADSVVGSDISIPVTDAVQDSEVAATEDSVENTVDAVSTDVPAEADSAVESVDNDSLGSEVPDQIPTVDSNTDSVSDTETVTDDITEDVTSNEEEKKDDINIESDASSDNFDVSKSLDGVLPNSNNEEVVIPTDESIDAVGDIPAEDEEKSEQDEVISDTSESAETDESEDVSENTDEEDNTDDKADTETDIEEEEKEEDNTDEAEDKSEQDEVTSDAVESEDTVEDTDDVVPVEDAVAEDKEENEDSDKESSADIFDKYSKDEENEDDDEDVKDNADEVEVEEKKKPRKRKKSTKKAKDEDDSEDIKDEDVPVEDTAEEEKENENDIPEEKVETPVSDKAMDVKSLYGTDDSLYNYTVKPDKISDSFMSSDVYSNSIPMNYSDSGYFNAFFKTYENLIAQCRVQQRKIESYELEKRRLGSEFNSIIAENNSLKAEINLLKADNSSLKAENIKCKNEVASAKAKLSVFDGEQGLQLLTAAKEVLNSSSGYYQSDQSDEYSGSYRRVA